MIILLLGLALWIGAHLFKRLAPDARAAMSERMGEGSKGVIAVALVISIVLMVIGYRAAGFVSIYVPPSWGIHLNNLLMLVAVFLLGLGHSKSRIRGIMRHPMLTSVVVWAVAHLLVNGDLASLVLFGALAIWALAEMVVINRAEPDYVPAEPGTAAGDVRLAIITVVVFAVISGIHAWLGYWPFPG